MSRFPFKLPDLAEGTVESELVAWQVRPGDRVQEGQVIAEMATEKAVVELPAPVTGRVIELTGKPGDFLAVGSIVAVFETDTQAAPATDSTAAAPGPPPSAAPASAARQPSATAGPPGGTALAAPATRQRAAQAGIDLTSLAGSGPGGRVEAADLDAAIRAEPSSDMASSGRSSPTAIVAGDFDEVRVIGVRRVIAERMAEASRTIPHFTYVEEIDVTELEAHRRRAIALHPVVKLTPLAYIIAALARVLVNFPQCNARYDASHEALLCYRSIHVGIATQTPDGLKVPVIRDVAQLDVFSLASEIDRVSTAARKNRLSRDELGGSTITVTSLGKHGGLVTTPVINLPEVAIIGVNRIQDRPVVRRGTVIVRQMMNLSSSFDHRFIDGYDAATMIQALKTELECVD